jgi:hypothetical protein
MTQGMMISFVRILFTSHHPMLNVNLSFLPNYYPNNK